MHCTTHEVIRYFQQWLNVKSTCERIYELRTMQAMWERLVILIILSYSRRHDSLISSASSTYTRQYPVHIHCSGNYLKYREKLIYISFKAGHNTDQSTFLLKQTASYFVTHGSSVHVVFLAVIAWLESMTRLDSSQIFFWLDASHVEKDGDSTRLESRFSQNDSTRVTINDSRLESESFLQNLRASDR